MIKKVFAMAVSCTMLLQTLASPLIVKAETVNDDIVGTTYYVSSLDGNDNNNGLSEKDAF